MKKTKINRSHNELDDKMIDFFGWDLPVQYSGLNAEHNAVRTTGGLFDVSHMGEIIFEGKEALEAVSYLTSNNVSKLKPGKIHYKRYDVPCPYPSIKEKTYCTKGGDQLCTPKYCN